MAKHFRETKKKTKNETLSKDISGRQIWGHLRATKREAVILHSFPWDALPEHLFQSLFIFDYKVHFDGKSKNETLS